MQAVVQIAQPGQYTVVASFECDSLVLRSHAKSVLIIRSFTIESPEPDALGEYRLGQVFLPRPLSSPTHYHFRYILL